jgi:hypothetical protein
MKRTPKLQHQAAMSETWRPVLAEVERGAKETARRADPSAATVGSSHRKVPKKTRRESNIAPEATR